MIRVIAREPLPPSEAASGRRLADPDLLLKIADQMQRAALPDNALADKFSHILHDLRMGGTWKRTNRGRLPITEEMIGAHILPDADGEIAVLDLGASDGITTLELVATLRKVFGNRTRAYMADVNLFLLRYRKGPLFEYRAANGEPIMARIGRLGLRLAGGRNGDGASDPIGGLYLGCAALRRSMRLDTRIPLVHPFVRNEPAITAMELDCLVREATLVDRFLAVRASNVLNLDYFTTSQLHAAVGNIHFYLRDGGCLLVSRNHDVPGGETENGSIWRKIGSRFVHLADFGVGSEIKEAVDGWTPS